jgi:hypothetical protein
VNLTTLEARLDAAGLKRGGVESRRVPDQVQPNQANLGIVNWETENETRVKGDAACR